MDLGGQGGQYSLQKAFDQYSLGIAHLIILESSLILLILINVDCAVFYNEFSRAAKDIIIVELIIILVCFCMVFMLCIANYCCYIVIVIDTYVLLYL